MTAREIIDRDCEIDTDSDLYIQVESSDGVVDAFTLENGTSPIYIETLEDTGIGENHDQIIDDSTRVIA